MTIIDMPDLPHSLILSPSRFWLSWAVTCNKIFISERYLRPCIGTPDLLRVLAGVSYMTQHDCCSFYVDRSYPHQDVCTLEIRFMVFGWKLRNRMWQLEGILCCLFSNFLRGSQCTLFVFHHFMWHYLEKKALALFVLVHFPFKSSGLAEASQRYHFWRISPLYFSPVLFTLK